MEKPDDWLPDGTEKDHYLKEDKEWPGLENRLGEPRILKHTYFSEVFAWIQNKYKENPDDFSFFEAGCGHGNDLRAIREKLGKRGRFLGVDMSAAEMMHGMQFYRPQENTEESRIVFAQGDLRHLRQVHIWNEEKGTFSQPAELYDGEFDLMYMEAVLHGFGYGKNTYREKKEAAQQVLNGLYRICKSGGKFFGRATVFDDTLTEQQRLEHLRATNNWRFVPGVAELEEMFNQAGFTSIEKSLTSHENAEEDPNKRNRLRFSFLAEK